MPTSSSAKRPPSHAAIAFASTWSPTVAWGVSLAVLAVVVAAIFGQTIWFDFLQLDDRANVVDNRHLRELNWDSIARFWRRPFLHLYIPVTYTFFAFEAWLNRLSGGEAPRPAIFHSGNVLLHWLNCALVLLLCRWIVPANPRGAPAASARRTVSRWTVARWTVARWPAALLAALLFAVHPLHVESVAWVTECKGLLCAAGSLASVACFWRALVASDQTASASISTTAISADSKSADSMNTAPMNAASYAWYAAASLAFALGMLSKPAAAAAPLIAGVLVFSLRRERLARGLALLAPWALVVVLLAIFTKSEQPDETIRNLGPWWSRPLIAADAVAFYLTKLIWPASLVPEYSRSPAAVLASPAGYFTWLLPAALVFALWRLPRRRLTLAALAVAVMALAPVLGLAPFGYQMHSTVADRYAYLALLGPCLAVAWLIPSRGGFASHAIGLGVVAVLAVQSYVQTSHWRDTRTLFSRNVELVPQSWLAWAELAAGAMHAGDFQTAEKLFHRAIEREPNSAQLHNQLGHVLFSTQRLQEAAAEFERALECQPKMPEALHNLGNVRLARNELEPAALAFQQAIEARPNYLSAHRNLAATRLRQERLDEAAAALLDWARRQPESGEPLLELGGVLARQRKYADAATCYVQASQRQPGWSPPRARLAWLLATSPDEHVRSGPEAVRWAEPLAGGEAPDARSLDILAAALAESGRFAEAKATARRALAAAGDRSELAAPIAARLKLYEAGQPYREP